MTDKIHQIFHFVRHYLSASRKGHGIHSPFAYALCEEVFYNATPFYDFQVLNSIRKNLIADRSEIEMTDLGAGSKVLKSKKRRICDIARVGISPKLQAELLYRLANYLSCRTIIELGTSVGLTTLYLSKACAKGKVYSVEGSKGLHQFAQSLAEASHANNIHFIHSDFDSALPDLLHSIDSLDLFYIDGNHTCEATKKYFQMAMAKKNDRSVFVLDDIYWSRDMTKAWNDIRSDEAPTLTIDLFYFGLVFFLPDIKEKTHLKMYI